MPSLRLLSIDARRFGRDRAALAATVAAAEADVACVHGAPHLFRWRSSCAAIGRRSGLVVVGGGRPAGANLLLSTLAVDVAAVRDVGFNGGSALNRPGAALAVLHIRGLDVAVVSATLIGNSAQRVEQARQLERAIDRLVPGKPPTVISSEGSDRPGTAAWQALVTGRVAVAGRIFVDRKIAVDTARDVQNGTVVELNL